MRLLCRSMMLLKSPEMIAWVVLEMGHMAINLTYRLIQAGRPGVTALCLLESSSKSECLRKRVQLLRDDPARFKGTLIIRTYSQKASIQRKEFGDGVYG